MKDLRLLTEGLKALTDIRPFSFSSKNKFLDTLNDQAGGLRQTIKAFTQS